MVATIKFLNYLKPYFFEGLHTAMIMGTGDLIAQTAIEKRNLAKVDWKRTVIFGTVGFIVVGPTLHHWYQVLERVVPKKDKIAVRGLKKMALDQFVFSPFFNVVVIGAFSFLSREKYAEFRKRLEDDYVDILLTSYAVWPLIQIINFTMVPLHFQVAVSQICGVLWNCYLSRKLNNHQ